MRLDSISHRSGRRWWWAFALLIATPALALALLGLRVAQLESLQRAQQTREEQSQLGRLTDTTISSMLTVLKSELARTETSLAAARDYTPFVLEPGGRLVFPREKTYFPDPSVLDSHSGPQWSQATSQEIERAQIADQQRAGEASSLFHHIGKTEPRLRAWSELALVRRQFESGDVSALTALANPSWTHSEGMTPSGLPVALLAATYAEGLPPDQRSRFVPLLKATLEALRAGRWWFSIEERRFYDEELRRLIALAGSRPPADDARLAEWASIERLARRIRPAGDARPSDPDPAAPFLLLWSHSPDGTWLGAAVSRDRLTGLVDRALQPLFTTRSFAVAIRHLKGPIIWSRPLQSTLAGAAAPLQAVEDWELVFSRPTEGGAFDRRRLLWYGFTLVVVMTMAVGLAVTLFVVKREVELNQLQSDFVAAVTHEFKSPITSIRLLVERLSSGRLRTPAAAGEYQDAIHRETDRLERLVNRVLESQKIQSGEKRYNLVPGSVVELAEAAIWRLRPQADAKNIGVDLELAGEIPQIQIDKTAVADALDNLVDNAIKYSPEGARVLVRIQRRERFLCVEVQDHGIGIDPEDLPRIFDRFYRGRRGDQHDVHGTGLGLALVKAAAEGHGGSVEVTSAPGQGARFCLRLPLES
ncbi:MAG TPA: HAMP domain-containing sensor histidine kinase [Bryobacteraceae bacterium]|nr:HAMP domain-containing sensor histidine kinase [Bryobacteraceae bacterium]